MGIELLKVKTVSLYTYNKAHQLATAGNITYTYDENGNVTEKSKAGKTTAIEYNSYNKPVLLQNDTSITRFYYNPDGSRYKKTKDDTTTYYIAKYYEEEITSSYIMQKNYIYAGKELVAVHTMQDDGNIKLPQNRYLHKDSLGSVDTITNESGIVIQRLSYKPFEKQLVQEWINDNYSNTPIVKRGYTGHEHIKEFNLIHMNGRVYDPDTARFLSADPNIQAPYDTQSYNRYSYVKNNPLKYTVPSGFFFKKLVRSVTKVFKGAVNFIKNEVKTGFGLNPYSTLKNFHYNIFRITDIGAKILHSKLVKNFFIKHAWARTAATIAATVFGGPGGAAASAAYFTEIQGGDFNDMLKSAVIAYASTYVASEIGDAFGHDASFLAENGGGSGYASASSGYTNAAIKAAAHGLSRVAFAKAQGQDTSSAFWSGFVSSGFAAPNSYGEIGGTVVTIVVSGTISEISGGKFANGAVTAAYIHLFNALNRGYQKAIDKNIYSKGKKYGDGFREVGVGTIKGALSTKNVAGAVRGGVESIILNVEVVGQDIKTTVEIPVYMGEQLVDDSSEAVIDYEESIKNNTFDWDAW